MSKTVSRTPYLKDMFFVYRNLHKKCFSIKHDGLVLNHAKFVMLYDVSFKVNERARQKVLETKHKNVHAGVVGRHCYVNMDRFTAQLLLRENKLVRIFYNPYKSDSFVDGAGNKLKSANAVFLMMIGSEAQMWAEGLKFQNNSNH